MNGKSNGSTVYSIEGQGGFATDGSGAGQAWHP